MKMESVCRWMEGTSSGEFSGSGRGVTTHHSSSKALREITSEGSMLAWVVLAICSVLAGS